MGPEEFDNILSSLDDAKSILDGAVEDFRNASNTLGEYLDILRNPLNLMMTNKEELQRFELKFKIHLMMASNKIDAINVLLAKDDDIDK